MSIKFVLIFISVFALVILAQVKLYENGKFQLTFISSKI